MDNASYHQSKECKEFLLEYNILWLPPYSPYYNIIELWFGLVKRSIDQNQIRTLPQIRKAISKAVKVVPQNFYKNSYQRLLVQAFKGFNLETLT